MEITKFARKILRKGNAPIFVYIILNIVFTAFAISVLFGSVVPHGFSFWVSLAISVVLYPLSVAVALTPFGEWILRKTNGLREVKRQEDLAILTPLFERVYSEARAKDPTIPEDAQLFITDGEANAFALGRRTICVTTGLLQLPPEQIEAALAHEFGHISHHDTDLILFMTVGNLIMNGIVLGFRVFLGFVKIIMTIFSLCLGGPDGLVALISGSVIRGLTAVLVFGLLNLWSKLGFLLVMKSSRAAELEADAFALELGYGNSLCSFLDGLTDTDAKGLLADLSRSHPQKDDRIAHLQGLGADYRADRRQQAAEPALT